MSCFVRWCCPFADNVRSRHILHAGLVLGAVGLVAMSPRSHAESDAVQGRMITRRAVVVNPETHKAYAVDEGAGTVSVIDEQTGSIRTVQVGQKPIAIAINRKTNRIYVANTGSSSISVIDGSRDAVIATIHCDAEPYVLAVNEATNTVYAGNDGAASLAVHEVDGFHDAVAPCILTNAERASGGVASAKKIIAGMLDLREIQNLILAQVGLFLFDGFGQHNLACVGVNERKVVALQVACDSCLGCAGFIAGVAEGNISGGDIPTFNVIRNDGLQLQLIDVENGFVAGIGEHFG